MDSKRLVRVAVAIVVAMPVAWAGAYYAGIHWVPEAFDSLSPMRGFNGPSEPLLPQPLPGFWGTLPADEQSTVVVRLSGFRTHGEALVIFRATVEDPLSSSFQRAQMFEFAVYDPAGDSVLLRNDLAAVEVTVGRSIPTDWKGSPKDLSNITDKLLFLVRVDKVILRP